ncbi:hypothetical protein [Dyadobacter sp. Leaf189]|uniref:hypothetical protein n=1 Tax=Dyadobacter sp. Leaf189 TaxID=1736295 RepID=UPI0006FAD985|nr:hypothetical protein [Dyadobacter sp. Leaf189]KQS27656.1 hypothetical protein ASG33_14565 [Dyadobacter sp. Leaf189]
MKMKSVFLLLVLMAVTHLSFAQTGETLTNNSIVSMYQANVSGKLIIQKINLSKGKFDMSVPGLLALKSVKLPEPIMEVMLASTTPTDVLKNENIIQLCQAGFSKRFIIQRIQAGPNKFNVTTDGLIQLQVAKVPEAITKVMMTGPGKSR